MIVMPSNRVWLSLLTVFGLLVCGWAPARAQQFSADLVITRGDGEAAVAAGKLRVSHDNVRIETPELADGFFLVNGATPTAYFVRPAAGTGWTRPVSPGVRCLPCISRPPPCGT